VNFNFKKLFDAGFLFKKLQSFESEVVFRSDQAIFRLV